MIVPVMAISNLVLTQQIYSEETNGAHAHYREPVPLIKCNKQQEKYRVSREKIVHRIVNIWINNLNFYNFLQFTVGKPELITT